MKRERAFVVYPFLVAVYGVLALAAKNSADVRFADLILPLIVSLAVAATSWSIISIATRNRHFAGLISLSVVVWFAWYGYFRQLLAPRLWLQWLNLPDYGVPLALLLSVGPTYLLARRLGGSLQRSTRYLNVTATVLVAIPALALCRGWIVSRKQASAAESGADRQVMQSLQRHKGGAKPDVYLLVLDEYTGARSLKTNFGFDNSPFLDSLRRLGFTVPASPRSNYVHTHLALAAMLNWQLLDSSPEKLKAWNGALAEDYAAIEDSRTWRYIHALGYRFVFFPSAFPGTRSNRFADIQIPEPSDVAPEFDVVWSQATVIIPLASLWCRKMWCGENDAPFKSATSGQVDWKFAKLATLPDSAGPLFVFAHLLLPHEPFRYRADCSHRPPVWPRTAAESDEPAAKTAYIEQIQCTNAKILHLTSELIRKSGTPPVILLQADHGNGRLGREFATVDRAGRDRIDERTEPFAAYYLPDHASGVIYDSITPVNVLPRIFNHYFDAGIPLQPDATYWSTWQEPFAFTRVQ